MKAPQNRKVFVIGYGISSPLGIDLDSNWKNAVAGESGFRRVTRCETKSDSYIVGEIPDWNPADYDFVNRKEAYNWNADFVHLTMGICQEAIANSGLEINAETGPKTACLIGSALNGSDAFRVAMDAYQNLGPFKVSPYLLPNLCANVPSGKAGMMLGFTGPIVSPEAACATGNYAIGLGAKLIQNGDCDFALAGGVDTCILPEIIQGFSNMRATIEIEEGDRAFDDPKQASRPFSKDRKGFVLSEGGAVIVLASEEAIIANGLKPKAEVLGIGWNSDAFHFTAPNPKTINEAISQAIEDAELKPADIDYVNTHGTSTPKGDATEIQCLRDVFGDHLQSMPISSNKSQVGHTLGGSSAIEAVFAVESMQNGVLLPTINHIPDPSFEGIDVVPNRARHKKTELVLSNAFGFGGTNCCVVFRGV